MTDFLLFSGFFEWVIKLGSKFLLLFFQLFFFSRGLSLRVKSVDTRFAHVP